MSSETCLLIAGVFIFLFDKCKHLVKDNFPSGPHLLATRNDELWWKCEAVAVVAELECVRETASLLLVPVLGDARAGVWNKWAR